jgi:ABC-type sugar transport system substrate-binding protein
MIRSRMEKLLLPAVLAAVTAMMLSSCKRSGVPSVGFAQEGDENAWRTAESKSVQAEADKRSIKLSFANAQGDIQKQIDAVRTFVLHGASAIILAPKAETGWEPVLKEARDAKIPVILIDRGVSADPELYTTLIASDFIQEGQRVGQWLAEHSDNKPMNIVELEGSAGAAPAIDRKKGFDEEITKHSNMKILQSQDGNFTREQGKKVMTNFLLTLGADKINAVYAHNDDMALGAIQAIEAAGKKPGTDIMVVSIDGIHDGLQAILDKKINCIVECNPILGPDAFDAVEQAIKGQPLAKHMTEKDALFDQSNLTKEILADRKY